MARSSIQPFRCLLAECIGKDWGVEADARLVGTSSLFQLGDGVRLAVYTAENCSVRSLPACLNASSAPRTTVSAPRTTSTSGFASRMVFIMA